MKQYEVGFSYKVNEFGTIEMEALNDQDAEDLGLEHVFQTFPEATDIAIDYVKEINIANG